MRMDMLTLLIETGIALALLASPCFACQHGYFGSECKDTCSSYCSGNGSCNPNTGVCDNGCKDGWSDPKCRTPIEKDGSTEKTITITISTTSAGICSGAGITIGVVLCLFKKKKACFRTQNSNPSTFNDNRSYHIYYVPPKCYLDGLENPRRMIDSLSASGRPAIEQIE